MKAGYISMMSIREADRTLAQPLQLVRITYKFQLSAELSIAGKVIVREVWT